MKQLLRYSMVGLTNNLISYLLYILVTYNGVEPKIAMTVLYIIGASINFLANKKFTFSDKGYMLNSGMRYVITYLLGLLLDFCILKIFFDKLGYPHQLVQGIATFVVGGFLFVCFKLFVFRGNCKVKESIQNV